MEILSIQKIEIIVSRKLINPNKQGGSSNRQEISSLQIFTLVKFCWTKKSKNVQFRIQILQSINQYI